MYGFKGSTLAESFILEFVDPNSNRIKIRKIKSLDFVDTNSRGINLRKVMGISSCERELSNLHKRGQDILIEVYGLPKILIVARTWPIVGSSIQGYKLLEQSFPCNPGGQDYLLDCNFPN